MANLWQREQQFIHVLNEMMKLGVKVDTEFSRRKVAIGQQKQAEILRNLGGRKPTSNKQLHELLIDELGLPVVRVTKNGQPSFDKIAMEEYEQYLENYDEPLAQWILAYRGWNKTTSTNHEAYLGLLSPDGRLRPHYNNHRVRTGRLSCSEPNLQNIPKFEDKKPHEWNWDVKKAFVAEDGYVLWEFDYSQVEFRLSASYANETVLLEPFNTPGRDVFSEMSIDLNRERGTCKTFTYATLYGAKPRKIGSILRLAEKDSVALGNDWAKRHSRIVALSERMNNHAERHKQIRLWTGRVRHLERRGDNRLAFNSAMQGGGAEIVKSATIRVYNRICAKSKDACRLILQVHDSLTFEIRESMLDEFKEMIIQEMANVLDDVGKGFPGEIVLERVLFPVEGKLWGT